MSLSQKLQTALAELEDPAALGQGPREIVFEHDEKQFRCEVAALDRIGCSINSVAVSSPALATTALDRLQAIGQQLAGRLTYLLEAIAVIEVDAAENSVQMRSQPPQRDERRTSYYELLVGRGRLELRRYTKEPGEPRRSVQAHLTREVLARLAEDFVSAV